MSNESRTSRRDCLKTVGAAGTAALFGGGTATTSSAAASEPPKQSTDLRRQVFNKVWGTPLIDTHEHLCDEQDRLPGGTFTTPDDWSVVFSGYLGSDLLTAGMPGQVHAKFFSKGPSTQEKWKLL